MTEPRYVIGGRKFRVGAWYAPKAGGMPTPARFDRLTPRGRVVWYGRIDDDDRYSCTAQSWLAWAGEEVPAP